MSYADARLLNRRSSSRALLLGMPIKSPDNPREIVIVGSDNCWRDNNPVTYEQLKRELGMPEVVSKGDGYYGAEIVDGRINVTFRPG